MSNPEFPMPNNQIIGIALIIGIEISFDILLVSLGI